MKLIARALIIGLVILSSGFAFSEPWLSSRFAQNCASCHSPGRINVPQADRRCTLSCQGCHTNPNGGGLRNSYGKWNQERFLNSLYVDRYKMNQRRPEVLAQQHYTNERLKKFLQAKDDKAKRREMAEGFRLRETRERLPESAYDRTRAAHEKIIEQDLSLARMRIPDEDPWRVRRKNYFNAGLDLRYFYMKREKQTGDVKTEIDATFPMAADLAVSAEPIHGLTLVYESRFANGPGDSAWYSGATKSIPRSAYVMVDDLPYNSFIMHGLYRPMFGHYNPDHYTLFASASGLYYGSVHRALTVGTAPNVPFFNFHYILPINDSSNDSPGLSRDQGYAWNLGGRWVTLGAYAMFSHWSTESQDAAKVKRIMTSFTGGGTLGIWTLSFDLTRLQRDDNLVQRFDAGSLVTLENRFRFWEESYFKFNYETLNATRALREGKSSQISFGVSSFLISSLELDLSYKSLSDEPKDGAKTTEKSLLGQAHFFF